MSAPPAASFLAVLASFLAGKFTRRSPGFGELATFDRLVRFGEFWRVGGLASFGELARFGEFRRTGETTRRRLWFFFGNSSNY